MDRGLGWYVRRAQSGWVTLPNSFASRFPLSIPDHPSIHSTRRPNGAAAFLISIIRSFSQSNHRILYLLFYLRSPSPFLSPSGEIPPLSSPSSPHRPLRQVGRQAGLITNSNVAGRAKQRRVAFCSVRWPDRCDGPDRPTVHPSMNRSLKEGGRGREREGEAKGRRLADNASAYLKLVRSFVLLSAVAAAASGQSA